MEARVSVIIPNYNGRKLLEKNLPAVIKNCGGCEIVVVDDASTDGSGELLRSKFRNVKVIRLRENKGFATAANEGAKNVNSKLILLLNSDVSPRRQFLKHSLKHFSDKNIFAVGLLDYSHEKGKIITKGRGGIRFFRGFFFHFPISIKKGNTFWVSGGSGLFDRSKFLELGGFDPIYKPFYWEDIDLAFKAWKAGYLCKFEPLSKVDHYHEEGSIIKHKTKFYISVVSYKNQFLFTWKHVSSYSWALEHLAWMPYHIGKAIVKADTAFLIGFLWAAISIPKMWLNNSIAQNRNVLSDQEVIASYDK